MFVFAKISTLYHTRLFEKNGFRKFVSDLWIDRGLKPISGLEAPKFAAMDAWEFAAKSKTARRFVTLGPAAAVRPSAAASAGVGERRRGSREPRPPPPPRRRGPGAGRDAPPQTRLDAWEFAAQSKSRNGFFGIQKEEAMAQEAIPGDHQVVGAVVVWCGVASRDNQQHFLCDP